MFKAVRAALTDPQKQPLIYVVVMVWLAGLSVNRLSNLIPGESPLDWLLILGVPVVILAFLVSSYFYRVFPRWLPGTEATVLPPRSAKGLVVLASPGKGIETAEAAVQTHVELGELALLWILHSEMSAANALNLKVKLVQTKVFSDDRIRLLAMSNSEFQDPEKVRQKIAEQVYDRLPLDGLAEAEVVIDITGGKKETTAGAFLAGLPPGRRLQVTTAAEINEAGQGIKPGASLEIRIDYKLTKARAK